MYDFFFLFCVKAFQQELKFLKAHQYQTLYYYAKEVMLERVRSARLRNKQARDKHRPDDTNSKQLINTSHMTVHEDKHAFTHYLHTNTPLD